MIGKGGFDRDFRGKLRHLKVAVKVLNTVSEVHMSHSILAWCAVNNES